MNQQGITWQESLRNPNLVLARGKSSHFNLNTVSWKCTDDPLNDSTRASHGQDHTMINRGIMMPKLSKQYMEDETVEGSETAA
jgi:hypothetical protein